MGKEIYINRLNKSEIITINKNLEILTINKNLEIE